MPTTPTKCCARRRQTDASMLAAWYERPGPAAEVLKVGELPDPEPGPGEVRVRVRLLGHQPGRHEEARRTGSGTACRIPRVIPHSDGAGVIDAVGEGVDAGRVGQRVWVYGAQSYRPFGTAAQLTVVPAEQAVELPDEVSDELGACLGIPGITAHRAVFGDGPVAGRDGPGPRRPRWRRLAGGAAGAPGTARPSSARCGAAATSTDGRPARSPMRVALDESGSGRGDPRRTLPTASTASSRSRSPTTSTSTPRSSRTGGGHRRLRHARRATGASPSGRCCSPTSRSGCSAATTSRPRRSARPRTT